MKIWLVLCAALSAAIVGIQIHKVKTRWYSFYVSPAGHLKSHDAAISAIYDKQILSAFERMYPVLQPGDELEYEYVTSRLPLLRGFHYEKLKVVRDKRHVAYFKVGQAEFYMVFGAVAALPFLILGIVVAFLRLSPQRQSDAV